MLYFIVQNIFDYIYFFFLRCYYVYIISIFEYLIILKNIHFLDIIMSYYNSALYLHNFNCIA